MEKGINRLEFEADNSEEDEVKGIRDSAVYARKSESHHPLGLYYLVLWKGYPKEENTWEPMLAVQHLRKVISTFYKDHSDKPTATSPPIDSASPMARPTIKPMALKRKRGQPPKPSNKHKKS